MRDWKTYFHILLTVVWLFVFFTSSKSQPTDVHSTYFDAALKAKTVKEAALNTQKACKQAIHEGQFITACGYCLQMGQLFYKTNQYVPGIRQIQYGLALADRYAIHNDTLLFKYYNSLGAMYGRLTMSDSASYWYGLTEKLLRVKPELVQIIPTAVDDYYYNVGFYFMRLGDQERAGSYIRKSVDMAKATGDRRSVALSYLQLANYYFLIYQYSEAATYYRKSLSGFTPESVNACWAYALLGNCLRAGGNLDEGLKWLRASKATYAYLSAQAPAQRDTEFEFESSYYLGKCEQLKGLDTEATRSYQSCIQVYQRFYGNRGELLAASWSGLAAIAQKQNKPTKALILVQQALLAATVLFSQTDTRQNPGSDDIKAGKALYEALQLKGLIWLQLYKNNADDEALEQSIQTFRIGLHVAQRIRRSFTQLESTYFFNEKIQPCVAAALEAVFYEQSKPQSYRQAAIVFDLLQSYQAMSLTDALHEKAVKQITIPAGMLQQEQDIRQKLATAETQIVSKKAQMNDPDAIAQVSELKRQLYFFEDELARKYPHYFSLKYDSRTLSVEELQQNLDKQTAYLSYFLSDRFLYGFFATSRQLLLFRRVVTPSFTQSVKNLRISLEQNPGMFAYEGRSASNQLFDYLIRPVESYLPAVRRLIIERDDILNNIPFEVLEPAEHPNDYLCKRLALSYSYSARLTFTAAVAKRPLQAAGFAPYSEDSASQRTGYAISRLLRKSAAEVRETGGAVYLNNQATKSQFQRTIPRANLLHFATHATASDTQPELSSIHFSPSQADSVLRAMEIVNLPLDSVQLVVLSACEGNTGVLRKSEGLLSLARAFRLAGCPTILTTMWSAHDETTSELMILFYRQLRLGLPADVALQQARLEFFRSPSFQKWEHPFYWANFTLIGNPAIAFSETRSVSDWLPGLLIFVAISAGAIRLFRYLSPKPGF